MDHTKSVSPPADELLFRSRLPRRCNCVPVPADLCRNWSIPVPSFFLGMDHVKRHLERKKPHSDKEFENEVT